MTDFEEIGIPHVFAKVSEHESGRNMIAFRPFRPSIVNRHTVYNIIVTAKKVLNSTLNLLRIHIEADQISDRNLYESLGFELDGIEYKAQIERLRANVLERNQMNLPLGCSVRTMDFDKDIEIVANIEKDVHAADPSSRVNFETAEAFNGMQEYYRKSCAGDSSFVLIKDERVIGILGSMPDRHETDAVHISS